MSNLPLLLCAAAFLLCVSIVLFCYQWISFTARGHLHTQPDDVPNSDYALVLGTRKMLGNRLNLYFQYRIEAAIRLWRAGRVKQIVVSGDNRTTQGETEVDDMEAALRAGGVPAKAIQRDEKGLRTWLSVCNYRQRFGRASVVFVSQPFHNQRALFLARHHKLTATAFNAQDVPWNQDLHTSTREVASRLRAFFDVLRNCCLTALGRR